MPDTHYFQRTDRRGAYLVLGEGDTPDAVTASGRWAACDERDLVDVGAFR